MTFLPGADATTRSKRCDLERDGRVAVVVDDPDARVVREERQQALEVSDVGHAAPPLGDAYRIAYVLYRGVPMTILSASAARKDLFKLIDEVADGEPVHIAGPRHTAVLVGEDDWRAIQETLFLQSIPGMRESIIEGMATPASEMHDELDW